MSNNIVIELIGHSNAILSMCLDKENGWLFSGSVDRTIRQWDTRVPIQHQFLYLLFEDEKLFLLNNSLERYMLAYISNRKSEGNCLPCIIQ
jgi:WD40 repeat protein